MAYPGSKVALLCFSVSDPDSLGRLSDGWLPELERYLPGIPIILVGCKKDLRHNQDVLRTLAEEGKTTVSYAAVR